MNSHRKPGLNPLKQLYLVSNSLSFVGEHVSPPFSCGFPNREFAHFREA
jgi:hypothetical protein